MKLDFILPPAQAGENYSAKIAVQSAHELPVTYLDIKTPDPIVLSINLVEGRISGIVEEPGEYRIEIFYFISGQHPITEKKCTVNLLVLPNPQSMWKIIPSDPKGIFSLPDSRAISIINANQRFVAASKRGRSHAHIGSYREDEFNISTFSDWSISVISDGAGSSKYSRKAADIICRTIPGAIRTYILSNDFSFDSNETSSIHQYFSCAVVYALKECVSEIERVCIEMCSQDEFRDFHATALICITKKLNSQLLVVSYSIGDGALAVYKEPNRINLLMSADSGDYSGQTKFLDQSALNISDVNKRTSVNFVSAYTAVFMMSDGVSDPYFETDSMLSDPEKWNFLWGQLISTEMFSRENPEVALLDWLDFWSKGNHDDRTIIIISPDNHA